MIADGWVNTLTSLGITGKDKRTGARADPAFLTQEEVESIYQIDDVAARIVDRVPEEMTREGFDVLAEGVPTLSADVAAYFDRYQIDRKIEQALKWGRLYGGAGIIMGVQGQQPDQPFTAAPFPSLEFVAVLDRYRLDPAGSELDRNLASPNFGLPVAYKVTNVGVGTGSASQLESAPQIHNSRVVRAIGAEVPWKLASQTRWWGDSVLSRLYNAIRNYQSSHDSAALIMQDFTTMVVKLKHLADMLASGDDAALIKRMQLLQATKSIVNAVVLQTEEEAEMKTTTITGLPEMLRMINSRLVAATDIPHTILLGESPSGLGATGASEKRDWYDHIKNLQESILRPIIGSILSFAFLAKDGPTNGVVPPSYSIEFRPLWQMGEKESADLRKVQAETDALYLDRGVLDPDEVAESRFGSGQYSTETTLSAGTREALKGAGNGEEA